MSDFDPADRELLAHVREMFDEADPVPEFLLDAARATFSWRTIDAELAELTNDSLLEGAAVRAARVPRLLTFTADVATLVVEVAEHVRGAGIGRRLLGQILSPRPAEVDVRHAAGTLSVTADEFGRFRFEEVPPGPISLACRFGGATQPQLVTSWVTI
jgi:GNAT superfamily N-acetyltransferase